MSDEHGCFCWYELMTSDMAAAAAFYAATLGWVAEATAAPIVPYTRFVAGGTPVAGTLALFEDLVAAGVPPHWGGFVAVDDTDAAAARAAALGASIVHPPSDIPAIGRFAVMRDPQGAVLTLFRRAYDMAPPPARPRQAGFGAWRELLTDDPEAALAFYAALFGWTASTAIDMGAMGTYQLIAHNGEDIAGVMRRPAGVPVNAWGYYFSVHSAAAAVIRLQAAGGSLLNGPTQVPGGQWTAQALDPQGAYFGIVSWER